MRYLKLSLYLTKIFWILILSGFAHLSLAVDDGTLTYTTSGSNIMITGCVDICPSDLAIPGTIDGNTVTSIGSRAFIGSALTSVVIPDSVTTIGEYAFEGASLTSLTLGSGLKTIARRAFWQTDLTSLTIPDSVTSLGDMAFGDTPLKTLVIGKGLENQSSVGRDVFLNVCETLESVNIDAPKALGTYGQYSSNFLRRDGQQVYYYGYSGLHFGRFYDDTNNYNTTAYQCPKLEAITLGDNVITVGNNAFDANNGQGYTRDINGDGIEDIVVYAETMFGSQYNDYDASIEVYLGNYNLLLK